MMSPLEAAKRLADQGSTYRFDCREPEAACVYCDGREGPESTGYAFDHAPNCPGLVLPQIVAALEAAERMAAYDPSDCSDNVEECCVVCGEIIGVWRGCRDAQDEKVYIPVPHSPDCRWQALVAALKGETP